MIRTVVMRESFLLLLDVWSKFELIFENLELKSLSNKKTCTLHIDRIWQKNELHMVDYRLNICCYMLQMPVYKENEGFFHPWDLSDICTFKVSSTNISFTHSSSLYLHIQALYTIS